MYEYPILGKRHISRTHVYSGPIGQIWPLYGRYKILILILIHVELLLQKKLFQCG